MSRSDPDQVAAAGRLYEFWHVPVDLLATVIGVEAAEIEEWVTEQGWQRRDSSAAECSASPGGDSPALQCCATGMGARPAEGGKRDEGSLHAERAGHPQCADRVPCRSVTFAFSSVSASPPYRIMELIYNEVRRHTNYKLVCISISFFQIKQICSDISII